MQAGIAHHKICGCLLDLSFEAVDERTVAMVALPLFEDGELLPFFCEELFASSTMISRELVGPELRPLRVEFSYPQPDHVAGYIELFQCELQFDAPRNRMNLDTAWLARPLPGSNPLTAKQTPEGRAHV